MLLSICCDDRSCIKLQFYFTSIIFFRLPSFYTHYTVVSSELKSYLLTYRRRMLFCCLIMSVLICCCDRYTYFIFCLIFQNVQYTKTIVETCGVFSLLSDVRLTSVVDCSEYCLIFCFYQQYSIRLNISVFRK